MQSNASTVDTYIQELPSDRQAAIMQLRKICKSKLKTFEECMSYGMIGYVVSHKKYPNGYHCDPKLPLPFVSIASQKNFIALYHMGIYCNEALLNWFVAEYPKHAKTKLDMGKSCIRFKKIDDIPYTLIEALLSKMNADDWIKLYESSLHQQKK